MKRLRVEKQMTRKELKENHLKQIFMLARGGNQIRDEFAGISRAEIKAELKLTFPSITALVDELISADILVETGERGTLQRGRPRTLLRVNPKLVEIPVFALERDGYHFVLYDIFGKVIQEEFFPYTAQKKRYTKRWHPSLEELCSPIISCIKGICENHPLSDIVLSIPGNIDKDNDILSSSYAGLVSPPGFIEYLENETGHNVFTINSADSFGYAELTYDAALRNYVYIYISDGIGASIVHDGYIFQNDLWRVGEIGHMSVNYHGRPCFCGNYGCLERYLCKKAIIEDCQEGADIDIDNFADVCRAYLDGNAQIEQIITHKAQILCTAINNLFAVHSIDRIIIGGDIINLGPKFFSCLEQQMESRISNMYKGKTQISCSKNKNKNNTFGAFQYYVSNIMRISV